MLHPKQLIKLFKNTSQFLTGQWEDSTGTPLPAEAVSDQLINTNGNSPAEFHNRPNQDQSFLVEAITEDEHLQTMGDKIGSRPNNDDNEQDNSHGSTSRERLIAGKYTCQQLEQLTASLKSLCRESDPQFVHVGRALATVTKEVRKLTETIHHAVGLIQNDQEGNASLKKTETLVEDVFSSLSEDRKIIDQDVVQVKKLVSQIFQCTRIREMIDRINSLFRIIRVNIQIQCSSKNLSDEMFAGVSEDLEHLAKKLRQVTQQILRDILQGAKSLTTLQKSITEHLKQIDQVFQQAKTIVSKAFNDIRQLMQGAETMIKEADTRSKKVSDKVGEVVVSIQFHDSLSQRVDHMVHAFEDIGKLCGNENAEITEEHLGTAFIILDLQLRQLLQICKEVKLVRKRIKADFLAIESEVEGLGSILHDKQFREISPQQFLSTLFSSLEDTLMQLNSLLAEGEGMIQDIEETAGETKTIASDLMELKENVSEIHEETRIQAVNTLIMASTLGHKGKTIEVLAKEIQALSNKSSVLADDVEAIHLAVNQTVEELIANTAGKENHIDRDNVAKEISSIKNSFSEIIGVVTEITRQIEITASHIQKTRSELVFLDTLESDLDSIVLSMNKTRDKLAQWDSKGTHDSKEIEQLIQRYSMAQELMIHMFDQGNDAQESGDQDDVFF